MKMLLLTLCLVPTLALANLDDSVSNGASSTSHITEYKTDFGDFVGASLVSDDSRMPATDGSTAKKFKFPIDGYDAGTSVK